MFDQDTRKRHPTMTHHQSALTTLISEVLTDPDLAHNDVFRRLLQAGLQDLIDAEATAKIGAGPHERTPDRITHRNGTRPKTLATRRGRLTYRSLSCVRAPSSRHCCPRAAGWIKRFMQ